MLKRNFRKKNPKINNKKNQISKYIKCAYDIDSPYYSDKTYYYNNIINTNNKCISEVDIDTKINIKLIFHYLCPSSQSIKDRVNNRVCEIISSLNNDFNNYDCKYNEGNTVIYENIVKDYFKNEKEKINIYLQKKKEISPCPSNICFKKGGVFFYPIKKNNRLVINGDSISNYISEAKKYIGDNNAYSIDPFAHINIWISEISNSPYIGYSIFPWEQIDHNNGIFISKRCFFPEDYTDNLFGCTKIITHQMGHYFGLVHTDFYCGKKYNYDDKNIIDNPYIFNFMTTGNNICTSFFTLRQIKIMRFMILHFRQELLCESDVNINKILLSRENIISNKKLDNKKIDNRNPIRKKTTNIKNGKIIETPENTIPKSYYSSIEYVSKINNNNYNCRELYNNCSSCCNTNENEYSDSYSDFPSDSDDPTLS